jgi:hypothetical protein
MRIFFLSFLAGAGLAIGVEVQADDFLDSLIKPAESVSEEALPMPVYSPNSSNSGKVQRIQQADIIKASRVQRAKREAEQRLELTLAYRRHGIDTARPIVNSDFMFANAPRPSYRWYGIGYGVYSPIYLPTPY